MALFAFRRVGRADRRRRSAVRGHPGDARIARKNNRAVLTPARSPVISWHVAENDGRTARERHFFELVVGNESNPRRVG